MRIFTRSPWYIGGLAFECQQCGRCCAGPEEGYVWVRDEEIAAIAAFLGIGADEIRKKYVRREGWRQTIIEDPATRDCMFLQTGSDGQRGCAIYPVRPTQCRTWPFWATNLAEPEMWAQAGQRCRGVNCGKLIPFNEIESRRLATRV